HLALHVGRRPCSALGGSYCTDRRGAHISLKGVVPRRRLDTRHRQTWTPPKDLLIRVSQPWSLPSPQPCAALRPGLTSWHAGGNQPRGSRLRPGPGREAVGMGGPAAAVLPGSRG